MQVGDLATWVAAIGTVGTLAFSAYTIRRQVDRERAEDDEKRRMSARRVTLTFREEVPCGVVEVANGGNDSIYNVGVYIQGKSTHQYYAFSGDEFHDLILPGEKHRFTLTRRKLDAPTREDRFFVAQFSDSNGYCWDRYMMGRIEALDPNLHSGPWAES
jgi:hypothetical protein